MEWTLRRAQTVAVLTLLGVGLAAPSSAGDEETLTEIVNVLREQGLIDEDQHAELAEKAAKRDAKRAWADRVSVWGDFRARYEAFLYEQDVYTRATGGSLRDRHRGRYRGRLNVRGDVASRATAYFRLASDGANPRGTNQTLGSAEDFDTDDIRFDLAYATLTPFPGGELPGVADGYLGVDVGKVKNPFLWKALGFDALLWDGDITPEGANLRIRGDAGPLALFANGGIYIVDENGGGKDPKLAGGQFGGSVALYDHVTFGARGSVYHFFSLDDAFYARAAGGGNLLDGVGRRNVSIQIAETSAYLSLDCFELVPVLIFGSYATNLSARSSAAFPGEDRQDAAYAAGIFVGDEVQLVELGFGWYRIEANAFPSNFLDSDLADGITNRHGYFAEVERQLIDGVSLRLTGYSSKRIEGGPAHASSGPGSDRLRGRADMIFEF